MVGNIVDVGWATIKSGCLPITAIYISKFFCVSEFGKVEVTSTPAESSFFKALALLKLLTVLHYHIYSEFRQTSKNFEGGLPKNILEKNTEKGC